MQTLTYAVYLISAVFFILGLKNLSSAATARRGNFLSMMGMLIAIIMTLLDQRVIDFTYIIIGLIVGAAIGEITARKIQMTSIPQMVALFNGFGGIASALVALAEYTGGSENSQLNYLITLELSLLIGTVTFTGSLIAFTKLQGILSGKPLVFRGQQFINARLVRPQHGGRACPTQSIALRFR